MELVFKATVPEILQRLSELSPDLKHGPFLKTKFAMTTPEVVEALKEVQSVVLFGVEVRCLKLSYHSLTLTFFSPPLG